MLRSIFLLGIYLSFLGLGMAAPFVFTLGYAWVDTFQPQHVAFIILNQIQPALVIGLAALIGYFAMDRQSPPRFTLASALTLAMAVWVTLTMFWAEMPADGWVKWNWAFKTVLFSAFIPLVIRSRVQIEAFVQTYVFSLAANFIPFGLKVLISGGGYGRNLGLESGNSDLAEGGLLSTVCLMAIPLALYLGRYTLLLPRSRLIQLGYLGLAGLALVTALGTVERSALVGLAVLGLYMFTRSRHKFAFGICLVVVGMMVASYEIASLAHRADTSTHDLSDDSAAVRLAVWTWTFKYALAHPFGGGFDAYEINHIALADGTIEYGRAFHSIYFEVLGEQGWVGLALFLGLAGSTLLGLRRLSRRTRNVPHLVWCSDLSDALQSGLAVFLTAGAFVGISFQPMFWYFVAASVSLREYVHRVERQQQPATGWRGRVAPTTTAAVASPPAVARWRDRAALGGRAR